MMIRAVFSKVPRRYRDDFGGAQAVSPDDAHEGYLGRVGGWNLAEEGEACLLSMWKDDEAYIRFMESTSSGPDSPQPGLFHSSRVSLWQPTHDFSGPEAKTGEFEDRVARLVQVEAIEGRQDHFRHALEDIWLPGMTEAGIQRGLFMEPMEADESNRVFLLLNLWDQWAHARFYLTAFGELLRESRPDRDVAELHGRVIELEPAWCF